jgi:hypothetical protein
MEITITITDSQVAHLLCSAREGGSNYWATFEGCPYSHDAKDLTPLRLPVRVQDNEDDVTRTLDRNAINRGILCLVKKENASTLGEILGESGDRDTGDAFLQLCLFGEVIYG